ncbi:hypothetical protein PENTCL1PPCAC_27286, partial [Pristionchus entomophagus]
GMEYRETVDRSNHIFLNQLELTHNYLKERAIAAFEYHTQLIDANIDGGVAEFDAIANAFSIELGTLLANSEKLLQTTHERLLEKIFMVRVRSEDQDSLHTEMCEKDFVRACRVSAEEESEVWSNELKKLEKALSNHRAEKRCKMLAEYRESHSPSEFGSTEKERRSILFRTEQPRLTPVDETDSEWREPAN